MKVKLSKSISFIFSWGNLTRRLGSQTATKDNGQRQCATNTEVITAARPLRQFRREKNHRNCIYIEYENSYTLNSK